MKVSELTRQIKSSLEGRFAGICVEGEISNFTRAASGHLYFTLKDEEAQIRGVMFRTAAAGLKFEVGSGMKVQAFGDVTVYPPRGEYQLRVSRLLPAGMGELQLAFEQLKKKLEAEGLFAPERKRPLPFMPRRIGVVTSPTGAAIRDIIKVLCRRFPNISVVLYPAKVQGDRAAEEVAAGIEHLNERGGFDVLIVGRGGGSLEDLWAFNEERVARAIAASTIPVISAVGHEIDFTIADFVADVRAPTPSAAAEIAVPDRQELIRRVGDLEKRLSRSLDRKLAWLEERYESLTRRALFRRPREMIEQHAMRLDELSGRMTVSVRRRLEAAQASFVAALNRLEPVSPLSTLKRGYSLVSREGETRPLTSAATVHAGDRLRVRLAAGSLGCRVTDVEPEKGAPGEQGRLPLE